MRKIGASLRELCHENLTDLDQPLIPVLTAGGCGHEIQFVLNLMPE